MPKIVIWEEHVCPQCQGRGKIGVHVEKEKPRELTREEQLFMRHCEFLGIDPDDPDGPPLD